MPKAIPCSLSIHAQPSNLTTKRSPTKQEAAEEADDQDDPKVPKVVKDKEQKEKREARQLARDLKHTVSACRSLDGRA